MKINPYFLDLMQCPLEHGPLHQEGECLVSAQGRKYRINPTGIPLFAEEFCSTAAREQQQHYDRIAKKYLDNLNYPHTQEYLSYLDNSFLELMVEANLERVAEICCGSGEAFQLLGNRVKQGIGIDISTAMLEGALQKHADKNILFLQADATMLPLQNEQFDSVVMLGGIHHVNDRPQLFQEIFRILKIGGKFYYREPVSDFFLWRWLRAIIYQVSSSLDENTERPLLYAETVPVLEKIGFQHRVWKTYGFLGYCLLMNSDVLIFNRLFRYLPGIRPFTRGMTKLDDWTIKMPGLKGSGLIVMGVAEKVRLSKY